MELEKKLKKIARDSYISFYRLRHKMDENKVLFQSFSGYYCDNPRAISEKLHELSPDTQIVWALKDKERRPDILPTYVKAVTMGDQKAYLKEIATAAAWVSNVSFIDVKKDKKQFFVQVWHGDRAFKKILYDSPFISKGYRVTEARKGFCNLAVAGSEYGEMQFRSAFHYLGEILCVGTPRNDCLVNIDVKRVQKIKRSLDIPEKANLLLYAPTLRRKNQHNGNAQEIQDLNIEGTLQVLERKYRSKWICLMRAHPSVGNLVGIEYNDRIRDLSSYEDMADLLLISDMLITDYSSCAGDFALTGRPLVLYQSDRAEYLKTDRSFYFDIESSPYYIAENQKELEDIINNFEPELIKKNCQEILDFYKTTESGQASEVVAKKILDWLDKDY